MWQEAISRMPLDRLDELILTNSSVFGPVGSFKPLFDKLAASPADLFGATENYDEALHLQSYFVVFRKSILRSESFGKFWSTILPYRDKRQVILSYEIGMSRFFSEQGFALEAAVSLPRLFLVEKTWPWMAPFFHATGNPTCRFPAELVERGLPFVKVEALRDNPFKVELEPVYQAMRRAGYDLGLIEFDRPRTVSR
jgi:lipopolysaccharide biosynthesis protein